MSICGCCIAIGSRQGRHVFPFLLLLILLAVEMNDIFAFCVGKSLGRRKLAPNTSPGKTVEGAAGALVLTTLLVWVAGSAVFRGTALDQVKSRLSRLLGR